MKQLHVSAQVGWGTINKCQATLLFNVLQNRQRSVEHFFCIIPVTTHFFGSDEINHDVLVTQCELQISRVYRTVDGHDCFVTRVAPICTWNPPCARSGEQSFVYKFSS